MIYFSHLFITVPKIFVIYYADVIFIRRKMLLLLAQNLLNRQLLMHYKYSFQGNKEQVCKFFKNFGYNNTQIEK